MKHKTDIPSMHVKNVVLVRPQCTVGHDKEWARTNPRCLHEQGISDDPQFHLFEHAYSQITGLGGIVHEGNFYFNNGDPVLINKCGGRLKVQLPWGTYSVACLQCTGCGANLEIQSKFPYASALLRLQNMLLHLMLKQMEPLLPSLNYLDCSRCKDYNMRELGLVSLAANLIVGKIDKKGVENEFGLAFTLMPSMDTLDGFDGFDRWVEFLRQKKFEHDKNAMQLMQEMILGPKQAR